MLRDFKNVKDESDVTKIYSILFCFVFCVMKGTFRNTAKSCFEVLHCDIS